MQTVTLTQYEKSSPPPSAKEQDKDVKTGSPPNSKTAGDAKHAAPVSASAVSSSITKRITQVHVKKAELPAKLKEFEAQKLCKVRLVLTLF